VSGMNAWSARPVRNYRTYCEIYRTVADVIGMTASGQSRRCDGRRATSGLPLSTDIARPPICSGSCQSQTSQLSCSIFWFVWLGVIRLRDREGTLIYQPRIPLAIQFKSVCATISACVAFGSVAILWLLKSQNEVAGYLFLMGFVLGFYASIVAIRKYRANALSSEHKAPV
jgi:hypothetical protein